jgi:hypothetical protein
MRSSVVVRGCSVLVVAVLGVGAGAAGAAIWRVEVAHPKPFEALNDVSCTASGTCMAVGYNVIEREVRGRWERQKSLPGSETVSCRREWCVVVGSTPAALMAEIFNGSRRTVQRIPTSFAPYGQRLADVSCVSLRACVAVGDMTVFTTVDCPPDPRIPMCITSVPLVERWNGSAWSTQSVPEPAIAVQSLPRGGNGPFITLDAVSCTASNACTALGDWGQSSRPTLHLFAEHWNGRRWTITRLPSPGGFQYLYNDSLSCVTADACVAVGSYGVKRQHLLAERWNGDGWRVQRAATPAGSKNAAFTDVSCIGRRSCTAVGWTSSRHGPQQPLAEHWNGRRWTIERAPSPPRARTRGGAFFWSVSCVRAAACVATGNYGESGPSGWFIERYS